MQITDKDGYVWVSRTERVIVRTLCLCPWLTIAVFVLTIVGVGVYAGIKAMIGLCP